MGKLSWKGFVEGLGKAGMRGLGSMSPVSSGQRYEPGLQDAVNAGVRQEKEATKRAEAETPAEDRGGQKG